MTKTTKKPIKWLEFSLSADTLIEISNKIHEENTNDNDDEYCSYNDKIDDNYKKQKFKYVNETTWSKKLIISSDIINNNCQSSSSMVLSSNSNKQSNDPPHEQQFFLRKTLYRWLSDDQPLCENGLGNDRDDDDDDDDEINYKAVNNDAFNRTLYKFEYHIIYNCNYQAPVLYFSICDQDGGSVSLEWLWKRLPTFYSDNQNNDVNFNSLDEIYENFGNIITQTNHPIYGHVVFMVHPCQTTNLMGQVLTCKHCLGGDDNNNDDDNEKSERTMTKSDSSSSSPSSLSNNKHCTYLITWLSSLASYIGLSMSLNYAKFIDF